jgi:L-2-hydroxyglutarate oxidase LhgO
MNTNSHSDYLIIGGGIVGLSIAIELKKKYPDASITLIDKEPELGLHSSGRNSGVLHAGFYYTADSLKARFTREGNALLRAFCHEHDLPVNEAGKVVVAANAQEDATLETLMERGEANGVELEWLTQEELQSHYPNVATYRRALFSPTTATVNPKQVTLAFGKVARELGAEIRLSCGYVRRLGVDAIHTACGTLRFGHLINAAGLYADRIAHDFYCGQDYTILPFKGIYLKDPSNRSGLLNNIYPVPNLANPFLGVHFTLSVDNSAKIGPTAIPAFWRENYKGLGNFSLKEMIEILGWEARLFVGNDFGFRSLAIDEMRKYSKTYLVGLARKLTRSMPLEPYDTWSTPGIRAQLLHRCTHELVQDFVVEHEGNTTHILGAVSPAFTASIPFARWVVEGL